MNSSKQTCFIIFLFLCFVLKVEANTQSSQQDMKCVNSRIAPQAIQKKTLYLLRIISFKIYTLSKNKKHPKTLGKSTQAIELEDHTDEEDHRLTLRIPKSLMAKIDVKRKQRIGKISRNLWILETLDKATKKII